MSPSAQFNAILAGSTVLVMYFLVTYVGPLLKSASSDYPFLLPIAAFLTSVGVYRLLTMGFRWLMERWEWLRKLALGPDYLNGTWIGWFRGHSNEFRYMIEYFEQDLDTLVIRGYSFTSDKKRHGNWHSTSYSIDSKTGKLRFTYDFNVCAQNRPTFGLNESLFHRKSKRHAPDSLHGLAQDLNDETRIPVQSVKVSNQLLPIEDALELAVAKFKNV